MNKIKDTVLEKLMNLCPTNAQVSIFTVITRYQEDNGRVRGAYYKDVCKEASCSYPTFYSSIRELEKLGMVKIEQNDGDWDIYILDNDFTKGHESFAEGYLDMNHDIFYSNEFFKMTAVEKLLAMHLIRKSQKNNRNGGKYHVSLENFYSQYENIFKGYGKKGKLSKRVLQLCMKNIKIFFNIGIFDKKYWISPKEKVYKKDQVSNRRTEEGNLKQHLGKVICRREKLKYSNETFQDTVNLINTFKERLIEKRINPVDALYNAIKMSLEVINKEVHNIKKWKRELVPSLVNRMINDKILGENI